MFISSIWSKIMACVIRNASLQFSLPLSYDTGVASVIADCPAIWAKDRRRRSGSITPQWRAFRCQRQLVKKARNCGVGRCPIRMTFEDGLQVSTFSVCRGWFCLLFAVLESRFLFMSFPIDFDCGFYSIYKVGQMPVHGVQTTAYLLISVKYGDLWQKDFVGEGKSCNFALAFGEKWSGGTPKRTLKELQ